MEPSTLARAKFAATARPRGSDTPPASRCAFRTTGRESATDRLVQPCTPNLRAGGPPNAPTAWPSTARRLFVVCGPMGMTERLPNPANWARHQWKRRALAVSSTPPDGQPCCALAKGHPQWSFSTRNSGTPWRWKEIPKQIPFWAPTWHDTTTWMDGLRGASAGRPLEMGPRWYMIDKDGMAIRWHAQTAKTPRREAKDANMAGPLQLRRRIARCSWWRWPGCRGAAHREYDVSAPGNRVAAIKNQDYGRRTRGRADGGTWTECVPHSLRPSRGAGAGGVVRDGMRTVAG